MFAEQQGRLDTSDRLSKYFGPFPGEKDLATIHHLATHKAGLVMRGYDGLAGGTRSAFVASVKAAPMESRPGESYRYSNAGSSLMAAVLEVATGNEWSEYLRKTLFTPAGVEARFDPEVAALAAPVAKGYAGLPPDIRTGLDTDFEWGTRGADGVYGRAIDVFNWVSFILRSDALNAASRSKLLDADETETYGWHVTTTSAGRNLIHKGGDSVLYTSQVLYYPDEDVTIVWLVNDNSQRWRTLLNRSLSDLAFGEPVAPPPPVKVISEDALRLLAGRYQAADGLRLEIRLAEKVLLADGGGLARTVILFANGGGRFTGFDGRSGESVGVVYRQDANAAAGLTLTAAGAAIEYLTLNP